jgi:hypothetical protein
MCKKLIFVLAMLAMVVPATGDSIILKVDIDAYGYTGPNETQVGWEAWEMPNYWGPFGPVTKDFGYGSGLPIVQIDGVTKTAGSGNLGGSRDRWGGATDACDCVIGEMLSDLVYVAHTATGMGKDYFKVSFNFGSQRANQEFDFTFWGWDPAFSMGPAPPDSKWMAWSTTDPNQWLTDNGYYDPNGYGYPSGTDSNMPAGLMAIVNSGGVDPNPPGMALLQGDAPWVINYNDPLVMIFASTV